MLEVLAVLLVLELIVVTWLLAIVLLVWVCPWAEEQAASVAIVRRAMPEVSSFFVFVFIIMISFFLYKYFFFGVCLLTIKLSGWALTMVSVKTWSEMLDSKTREYSRTRACFFFL